MLIDDVMPDCDFVESHARQSSLDVDAAWQSVLDLDLAESRVVRALLFARGLGAWRRQGNAGSITFDDIMKWGFIDLGTSLGEEKLLGLIGEFWKPRGEIRRDVESADFATFAEPGYVKAAWNFTVAPLDGGTIVATETRIQVTDAASLPKFRRYWRVMQPFSGVVRRQALKLICHPRR
ncbi:MAG: hypothetical protein OEM22_03680 [Acidimicrobiia bacterium]|nr:hypothetical protein [Acidimicrobiia bacterium]MDH3471225.1 hypothetical protein [Acidimicrobiia bacterium]